MIHEIKLVRKKNLENGASVLTYSVEGCDEVLHIKVPHSEWISDEEQAIVLARFAVKQRVNNEVVWVKGYA